jgi:D-arabinose 1-dehydrogenase-like Zn-dependent alcohol dehydrogenase
VAVDKQWLATVRASNQRKVGVGGMGGLGLTPAQVATSYMAPAKPVPPPAPQTPEQFAQQQAAAAQTTSSKIVKGLFVATGVVAVVGIVGAIARALKGRDA